MTAPAMVPVPATPADASVDWVNAALHRGGTGRSGQVVDVTCRPLIGETGLAVGFVAGVYRLRLTWDPAGAGPASVILKLRRPDRPDDPLGWRRDLGFYQRLQKHAPVPSPRCYWSGRDAGLQRFGLLLEDLSEHQVVTEVAACSLPQAQATVRVLGRLHAAWWGNEQLTALPWLRHLEVEGPMLQPILERCWPLLVRLLRPAPPAELGAALVSHLPYLYSHPAGARPTLVHGELRSGNLLFPPREHDEPALIDWAWAGYGYGRIDLAYFLGGSLLPELRRRHQHALLELYHRTLTEGGVAGCSFESCWLGYRLGLLQALTWPSFLASYRLDLQRDGLAPPRTLESLRALAQATGQRLVQAVVEERALELLPGDPLPGS